MTRGWRISRVAAAASAVAALVLFFIPAPEGAPPGVMQAAAVVVLTVGLWASAVLPEYLTAAIFFALSALLAIAPPNVVFSGFHSGAVWLIFGGLVIGVAVQATGLGARIARRMVGAFRGSYLTILFGIVLLTALLALFIPSAAARVMILMPIVMALADRLGFKEGSKGYYGMTLAVGAGSLYPAFGIMPAAVPNMVFLGAAESLYGFKITYAEYLYLNFPVIGPVSVLVLPFILRFLFPDEPNRVEQEVEIAPMSGKEKMLLVLLIAALTLWMTDFAHGISPAWISLAAGVLCLLPRVGVLPPNAMIEKVNFGPVLFVAGVIGMAAVVNASGLGELAARWLFSLVTLQPGEDFRNFASVAGIGAAIGLVVGMPGQPAIMSALASGIADSTGWPLSAALMIQMATWSMAIFPYQVPPIVVAMFAARLPMNRVVPVMMIMALLSCLVIAPLQFLWWRYVGLFG